MREIQVVIRIRPIDLAAVVSVLLHAIFFTLMPSKVVSEPPGPQADAPMNVVLAPPQAEPAPPEPEATAAAAPARSPPHIARRPAPLPPRFPPPPLTPPVAAPPVPLPERAPGPPVDMMAAIEARRAQRRAADAAAARGGAPASGPTDAASRNLQTLSGHEGVGGVFQVLRKSLRSGEFAFNGWRPDSSRKWREVIEVEAKPGEDIEIAMVRRMITLIRSHYTGDFSWDSHRLGRVVTLSARPEDQPGLEEFLMKEFFGTPLIGQRR